MSDANGFHLWDDMDLFSKEIDLYYKGKSQKTSLLGRIFTFLYIAIYIAFFIYKLVRMHKRMDGTFYDTKSFNGEIPSIQISNDIFYTTIALIHPLTKLPYYDPSVYEINVIYYSLKKNASNMFEPIEYPKLLPIERCKISNFGSNFQSLFENKQVELSACVPSFNKLLRGHRTYDLYSYYEINFYPCVNSSENNFSCRSPEVIEKLLTQFGINFKMQDIELTPQNYENPIQYRVKELTLPASKYLLLNVYAYIQLVNIETDEDVIGFEGLGEIRKQRYLQYEDAQILIGMNSVNFTSENKNTLATISITLTENELTQTRTYPKLITVLGDVGGLMELIFSFLKILSALLTEGLYRKSLVNHLFAFDLNKNKILIKNQKLKNFNKSETIRIIKPNKIAKKPDINNIEKNSNKNLNDIVNYNENNIQSQSIVISKHKSVNKKIKKKKIKKNTTTLKNEDKTLSNSKSYKSGKLSILSKQQNNENEKYQDIYGDYINEKEHSKRNLVDANNIEIIKKNLNENLETEKDYDKFDEKDIIKKIKINKIGVCFSYYFFCRRREYVENILIEEGMKLIIEKLEIQNLFKKIYKDDITGEKDIKLVEMSEVCKSYLKHINDKLKKI